MQKPKARGAVSRIKRIGFISTRFAGTDGVTLETAKWVAVLKRMGYSCHLVAGELEDNGAKSYCIPEAAFTHPAVLEVQRLAFGQSQRSRKVSKKITKLLTRIKNEIYKCQEKFQIDLWIAENCLAIPMNIPLGVALTEFLAETALPCIAHHHDFYWERERFATNAVSDHLHGAFPPNLPSVQHVVISSVAAVHLGFRLGLNSTLVPNVMDFEHPPKISASRAKKFRRDVGVAEGDLLILQPTRVVPRKRIEHAIEFVRRLDDPRARLIITHSTGDEGDEYARHVRSFARYMNVPVRFVYDLMKPREPHPKQAEQSRYDIADAYAAADFVTYPSGYEGFGNAFLEAVYFRRPVLCNRYSIFQSDIEPKGFRAVTMDGFVGEATIEHARRVLDDGKLREEMARENYRLAKQYYSYSVLESQLESLLTRFAGSQR